MAVAPTVPYGLPLFDDTSAITPWQAPFNAISNGLNTALGLVVPVVADLTALAALAGMPNGADAFVTEGGASFSYNSAVTKWVQQTPATFATTAARDTAYAKASAAYRVLDASALVTADGGLYVCSGGGANWSRVWAPGQGPYAMAAGLSTNIPTGTAGVSIPLPAGRFTVSPIVTLGPSFVSGSGAAGGGAYLPYDATPNSSHFMLAAIGVSLVTVGWTAIQMTPTSAAG
ncbi:hypothetical protein ABIB54_000557 [Frigoribacterium sp. UYMn621]